MIEPLKPKQTLKVAELQDGDIIVFQRQDRKAEAPRPTDKTVQEVYGGFSQMQRDKMLMTCRNKVSDRFEDAREYYDFLEHKRTVRFHPHPNRCDQTEYPPFDLVLNSKLTYDAMAEKVGAHLGVPGTHVRFWTVSAATNNPKTPVRRGTNPTLRQILNLAGTNALNNNQRGDAFYFEVLEMSLAELDTKKSVKITWLSEGISKEVSITNHVTIVPQLTDDADSI